MRKTLEPTRILESVNIDSKIKEGILLDGILTGLSNVDEAKKIVIPNIGFYDEKTSEYRSKTDDLKTITDKSIRRVSIELGNGNKRYFQQIDYIDGTPKIKNKEHGSNAGLRVSAWQEIDEAGIALKKDGKQEIRINFAGYSGGDSGHHDKKSRNDFLDKKLNPQTIEAAEFTGRVIQKLGKDNISNVIYGAHSMGAANALAAHIVSNLAGVATTTTLLLEPVGASSQLTKIKEAMQDEGSNFFKQLQQIIKTEDSAARIKNMSESLDRLIVKDVVSIRTVDDKQHGSRASSMVIGKGWRKAVTSADRRHAGEDSHESNETIGKSFLLVLPKIADNIKPSSWIASKDPIHTLSVITHGVRDPNASFMQLVENMKVNQIQVAQR